MNNFDKKMEELKFRYIRDKFIRVSDLAITEIEKTVSVKLPEDYLEFVKKYGGTSFDGYAIAFLNENGNEPEEIIVDVFYGVGRKVENYDLLDKYQTFSDRIPKRMLPIAQTPGSSQFCLSLSGIDKGKIYFWDMAEDVGGNAEEANLHLIDNSFEEFIYKLQPEE
jgi:SMI1-KNR4 cell-wall